MNHRLTSQALQIGPQQKVHWGESQLLITPCRGDALPPDGLITSVRCIILLMEQVLVVQDRISFHITPGGRREPNEPLEATLEREIGEETGWRITDLQRLGWLLFEHQSPKPPNYRYPYPDFIQLMYVAHASTFDAALKESNGYEIDAVFYPYNAPIVEALPEYQRWLLAQAQDLVSTRS